MKTCVLFILFFLVLPLTICPEEFEEFIMPFSSPDESGILPGFDYSKLEPVPPQAYIEEPAGADAVPLRLPPERTLSLKDSSKALVQPGPPAPSLAQRKGALSGKFIYVAPGHGWTYGTTWGTQRGNTNGMVEDHGNADQVCFFFLNYVKNAGATVIPLRDVGPMTELHIIDNVDAGFSASDGWNQSKGTPFWGNSGDDAYYVFSYTELQESAVARWTPNFKKAGYYPVFVWYLDSANRSGDALYRIVHKGGVTPVVLDQNRVGKGWVWLGTYYFDAGNKGWLELSNQSAKEGNVVIADAARFGSGKHTDSGYPMYEMNGLEYHKFSLAPSSVTSSGDVWSRPRMAGYMNNADVKDACYIGFHSNASGGRGACVLKNIDTNGGPLPYATQFCTPIITHVREELKSLWSLPYYLTIYTSAYGELNPNNQKEMTGTIIEVAFHDQADDAALLKTAGFRQDAARSVLKGIIDYFADTHASGNKTYLPDAPGKPMARVGGAHSAVISWSAPPFGGSLGGMATGYYVYKSADGLAWDNGVDAGNVLTYTYEGLESGATHYFRVAAYNAGGESFPSETVGIRLTLDGSRPEVLIVSGFRRYDKDISPTYTDSFNGTSYRVWPWLINSFNYAPVHGKAVADAGFYFETAACERVADSSVKLADYLAVIWILGQESTADETFSAAEQAIVATYLFGGGRIFVSGSDLGQDLELWASATAQDKNFLNNVLQAKAANNNASSTRIVNCAAAGIFFGLPQLNFSADYDNGYYNTLSPDSFTGVGAGALIAMTYADTGQGACIQYHDSAKRTIVMGFPFEMIRGETARADVMDRILKFLFEEPIPTPTPSPTPDPNAQYLVEDFEPYEDGSAAMFRYPHYSGTTKGINDETDTANVTIEEKNDILDPNVGSVGVKSYRFFWEWTSPPEGLVRATTHNMTARGNPLLDLSKGLSIYIKVKSGAVDFGYWIRETGGSGPIGANGGATGAIKKAERFRRLDASDKWQYVYFDIPNEPYLDIDDNPSELTGAWGTLESLQFRPASAEAAALVEIFVDDIYQGPQQNPLAPPTPTPTLTPTPTETPIPTPTPTPTNTPTPTPTPHPNAQYLVEDFEPYEDGSEAMFRYPHYSGTTGGINIETDTANVTIEDKNDILDPNAGSVGVQSYRFFWEWESPSEGLVRATTHNMTVRGNPLLDLSKGLSIYIKVKSGAVDFGYWIRETGGSGPIGANGGETGAIKKAERFRRLYASDKWRYVYFDIPNESYLDIDDNPSELTGAWGTLESLLFRPASAEAAAQVEIFVDDIYQGPRQRPLDLPAAEDLRDYLLGRGGVYYDLNVDGRVDAADLI